jgi:hypothetical protein
MPRLDTIVHNPAAASAVTLSDAALLVLLALMAVGLWVVVARGQARRAIRDFDESASDRGLEALRRRRLVVRRAPRPHGPQAADAAGAQGDASPAPR